MAIEQKDFLFSLIKSMTKSEKRQFRLYAGRLSGNKNANFIALFNLLDKVKSYDDTLILAKTAIKKQQISNTKAHLYKQLLKSLRSNPKHQNIRSQIREQFDYATILYGKGLYKQSLKVLDKAKEMAFSFSENNLAYEIVEFEKVIEVQYITRSMSTRADELTSQSQKLSLRNVFTSKLSNLSLQLYGWVLKQGYVKNDKEAQEITTYFQKELPDYTFSELCFKEKLFLYQAHLWYRLILQDFVGSYKYAQKWVDLFEEFPEMKEQHSVFFLKGINYLLESLFLIGHQTNFTKIIAYLNENVNSETIVINTNTSTLSFLYYYQNKLNQFFLEGRFSDGVSFIPTLLEELQDYKNKIDTHHIMVFYYKIACMYFGAGNNEKCIEYLQHIINNTSLKMREDLLCFSRILNLIAHYEAGLDYHIEKLIVETYRFLIKMNELHQVQLKIIQFLKKLEHLYPNDLKNAFTELHKDLKQYENHPYEKRAFLYLDILSWLESKITQQPVESIVREKARLMRR